MTATDAARLLALPLEEVADFIDLNRLLPSNPESHTGEGPLPHPPSPSLLSLEEQVMSAPTDSTSLANSLTSLLASKKYDDDSFLDSDADTPMSRMEPVISPEESPEAAPSSSPPASSSPESNQTPLTSSSPPIKTEMSIDPRPPRRDSPLATRSSALKTPSPDSKLTPTTPAPVPRFVPRVRFTSVVYLSTATRSSSKSYSLISESMLISLTVTTKSTTDTLLQMFPPILSISVFRS